MAKTKNAKRGLAPSEPKIANRDGVPSSLDWNAIATYACALPGAELSRHYGKPAVKVNGRAMLGPSREEGSFVLHIDTDTKQILMDTDPKTFWESPHYKGWPCVLVRYETADPDRVMAMVRRSWERATNLGPPRARAVSRSRAKR